MPYDISGALGAGYTADEIAEHLKANPDDAGFDVPGALRAGYSASEIIDHLNPKKGALDLRGVPVLAPIQRGIVHTQKGVADLAGMLGAPETAAYLRQSISQAILNEPTSGAGLVEDLKGGRIGSALTRLPSAVLEQALPTVAAAGAGLATGGAGPVAAAAARYGTGAAIGAATGTADLARTRAANNGRAEPNASDLTLGAFGATATGALGAAGLGTAGGVAGNVIKSAAADAGQAQLQALAGSVGTDKGAQLASGAETAAGVLTGAATRGALHAPEGIRTVADLFQANATTAGRKQALLDEYAALTAEGQAQQQRTAAAGRMLAEASADAVPTLNEPRPQAAARTAGERLDGQLRGLVASLDKQGVLGEGGAAVILDAGKAAANSQRTLLGEQMRAIDGLGLGEADTAAVKGAIEQRALLAEAGTVDTSTTPLGRAGGIVGHVAGMAAGALGVHPFVAGWAGQAGGAVGRGIGDQVAARFGLRQPALVKAARRASDMLEAAGVETPDTRAALSEAMSTSRDVVATQARIMGLDKARMDAEGAAEKAAADRWRIDYGDAQAMNRQHEQAQRDQRALEVGDATALDRQMTRAERWQRSIEVGDATALDRQLDQAARDQRGIEVGDAKAIDATRTRGMDLSEREGGKVAMIALRRAQAAAAAQGGPGEGAAAPKDTAGPLTLEAVAKSRARVSSPSRQPSAAEMSAPVPGTEGLSARAAAQGERLPMWQESLATKLMEQLHIRGMAENVNPAKEAYSAVKALTERGFWDQDFADALMQHDGHMVQGIYDVLRNEMLLSRGIDKRTLANQHPRN